MVVLGMVRRVIRRVIHPASLGDTALDISKSGSKVWELVSEALDFLTAHTITAIILTAYLIKRVGFGVWRTAKRSV